MTEARTEVPEPEPRGAEMAGNHELQEQGRTPPEPPRGAGLYPHYHFGLLASKLRE